MSRSTKLANLILAEIESLKETQDVSSLLALAEELTRDARALAELTLTQAAQLN